MKKFMSNPWVIGIGSTAIGGLVVWWLTNAECLNTINALICFATNTGLAFLNFELKVWWVLVAIVLVAVLFFIMAKYSGVQAEREFPTFLHYTKGSAVGYMWEWSYEKTIDGKYAISGLHPVCPECGMRLKQDGVYGQEMRCLRCNKTLRWKDSLLTDARMLIEDNIRRNYQPNR